MNNVMDLVSAQALSVYWEETVSNRIPYLGEALFPAKQKAGLDLAWIKGYKGLPIALKPSYFDTKATVRDRIGVKKVETEMPFFREGMTIKEKDRQELLRFRDNDPQNLYSSIIAEIYDDANQLIEGALIQPERMRMQLITTGKISLSSNNMIYDYNFDIDGQWTANNYQILSGTSVWSDYENSTPLEDLRAMKQGIIDRTGVTVTRVIMTQKTFNYLLMNKGIRMAINPLAGGNNVLMGPEVKQLIMAMLSLEIIIYDKKYMDENKVTKNFYPDDMITMIPGTTLGNTWFGTTPEEADLMSADFNGDVRVVATGVAVTTIKQPHPVNIETIVSEIVLPSFERMDQVGTIKVN